MFLWPERYCRNNSCLCPWACGELVALSIVSLKVVVSQNRSPMLSEHLLYSETTAILTADRRVTVHLPGSNHKMDSLWSSLKMYVLEAFISVGWEKKKKSTFYIWLFVFIFLKNVLLFDFREREEWKERNISLLFHLLTHSLVACMCPD